MEAVAKVQQRLQAQDMKLLMLGYAVLFSVVIMLNYPRYTLAGGVGSSAEVAWTVLLTLKLLSTCAVALAYGLQHSFSSQPWQATLAALLSLLIFSLPLDMLSYGVTGPAAPWWWLSALSFVALLGYTSLGSMLARYVFRRNLHGLILLLIPLLLALCFAIDFAVGRALLLPWLVQPQDSALHCGIMVVLSILGYISNPQPTVNARRP